MSSWFHHRVAPCCLYILQYKIFYSTPKMKNKTKNWINSIDRTFPSHINHISSDDHLTPPPSMTTGIYMQSGHMSPTHHVNNPQYHPHQSHQTHQSHYSTGTMTPLMHHQTHQQQQQHQLLSNDTASMSNIPVSVSVNPMPSSRSTTPKKWVCPEPFHKIENIFGF